MSHSFRTTILISVFSISACGLGDVVQPGGGSSVLLLAADHPLSLASAAIQNRYPNMAAANDSSSPKFIDSHPAGANRGELRGYGVTMIAHEGSEPLVSFDAIQNSSMDVDDPNLLFFEKRNGSTSTWPLIGAGYANFYVPGQEPRLTQGGIDIVPAFRFWVHEAGYHRVLTGAFECATDSNLGRQAVDAGKSLLPIGQHAISRDDIRAKTFSKRHGRYWTLHVWYDPVTGRPVVAETDPWERQASDARVVPDCAFYRVN